MVGAWQCQQCREMFCPTPVEIMAHVGYCSQECMDAAQVRESLTSRVWHAWGCSQEGCPGCGSRNALRVTKY